ncbi:MAG TPA: hypothetical protein DIT04_12675 [Dysgonomonas sp.]|nr:hypothetical protein [Dysgonomonas sp.]
MKNIYLMMLAVLLCFSCNNKQSSSNSDNTDIPNNDSINVEIKEVVNQDSINRVKLDEIQVNINKLKNLFNEKYDDMNDITWIQHKSQPKYANSRGFYAYIGKNNSKVWERFVMRYHGDDWLFVKNFKIKVGDNIFNLSYSNVERDNNSEVWEWIDVEPKDEELEVIENVISAKEAKIRFEGDQYYKDWAITQKEVKALTETHKYFELLKQQFELEKALQ